MTRKARAGLKSLLILLTLLATPVAWSKPVVVFDTDMDFDDAAALAYVAAAHKQGLLELKAVTVTGAGAGLPGAAIRNARCVLERAGLGQIPVADSSVTGPQVMPPELRLSVQLVLGSVLATCLQSPLPSAESAPALLTRLLSSQRSLTVLATGPLTNVAAALSNLAMQGKTAKRHSLVVMGGAVRVPGNLCCTTTATFDNTQELNFWADAPAVAAALNGFSGRTRLVPLDATNYVPLTPALAQQLAADRSTPEAALVADIANHPIITAGQATGGGYWWDPLAAMAVLVPDVVTFVPGKLSIRPDGTAAGRILESPEGASTRFGVAANAALFERRFLDTLNGR